VQSKVANLPDRSVRYLEAGSGRPAVFLHAFPLSADQWLPQLSRVVPGWRFVAPDLRGFRGVGPAFEDVGLEHATMDQHAADTLSLMTHLEIDRAVIVGLSMGGYVAFALLRRAAAKVDGLVLANTRATPDSAEGQQARDRMIDLARREGAAGVAREMLPKLIGATATTEQPDLVDAVRRLIELNPAEGIVSALRAMKMRPDSTPMLSSIACPTLVIGGGEDKAMAEADLVAMHDAIRGARLVMLPQVGHLSNLEAAGAFNAALNGFLNSGKQEGERALL
jgi:pimeloyl-ACP methyl ester carboxylesterase